MCNEEDIYADNMSSAYGKTWIHDLNPSFKSTCFGVDIFTRTSDDRMHLERRIRSMIYNNEHFQIKKVLFNPPATIVFWTDGTKTVVKRQKGDKRFDKEKGLSMAIAKKFLGNEGNYYNEIRKWCE